MLTEPGIIGKIGMNSAGLGCCLNILKVNKAITGLPVHILLRAILDAQSIEQVHYLLQSVAVGKASHVLVADKQGRYLSIEFAGEHYYSLPLDNELLIHSNHYLHDSSLNLAEAFPSTYERYSCAKKLLAEDSSADGIYKILLDQSEQEQSICRAYSPSATPQFGNVGTVFSVLIDMQAGVMYLRPGSSASANFYKISI
jgi:isopenicillin-N N-acyltransferase-like protein